VLERLGAGEHVVLLDVRDESERLDGVIPGARVIPLGALETRRDELEGCDEVVCYCTSGVRSRDAARILRALGLHNATSLVGGVGAWTAAGGTLVPPSLTG
jgi:rhodanese-related sulfurtransferase